jgi:catechol-2,3-dioxygenase
MATASACALVSAHSAVALEQSQKSAGIGGRGPRILGLELQSSVPLQELHTFYQDVIGLRVLQHRDNRLVIAGGETNLAFSHAPDTKAFYHFAFNIPENKIESALEWQKKRTAMLPIPERLRDANHSKEVVDYSHWNAHSIFFLDPAGNVVEYIARHDLKNGSAGEFGTQDLLYISEIGLIVDDVIATASSLKPAVGVEQYRGGDEHFTALGDECGLLLIMKRGRILNFDPSTDEKAARVFQTSVKVRGAGGPSYDFNPFPYKIFVDSNHTAR